MASLTSFTVRKTTDEEKTANMPYVTCSMIEAIQTCPVWGLIRNTQRRTFVTGFRQMALEAGSAMHEVFAVYNLWQVAKYQECYDHAVESGIQLFSEERFNALRFDAAVQTDNEHLALDRLAVDMLATSDFYDSPDDRKRTLANLEHAASELAHYFLMHHVAFPIYVEDLSNPKSVIGVEQSFDVVFTAIFVDGSEREIRFIGLGDVVYQNPVTKVVKLGEYKTTSGMNEGWREAFRTRHQLTAYNGALAAYFDNVSYDTILTGSVLPVPKTTAAVDHFTVERDELNMLDFLKSAFFAADMMENYQGANALKAPMFTHSCNRYFRPCSFLDLCSAHPEDKEIIYDQMETEAELSPSEMKALIQHQG